MKHLRILLFLIACSLANPLSAQSLVYEGSEGPGLGKHIVFLAGDHEYRSEETLPALARILAKHHGFKCTVLFTVDPKSGEIVPGSNHMPGTEALETADLMVIFLRFQDFPKEQMQPIVDYLERGGPVVGLRTSTHAFKIPADSEFARFSYEYAGKDFEKGFGRQILGETWAGHYGKNHVMSTRLDLLPAAAKHPVLKGVSKVWVQAGGYWTEPMADSEVLALAQPLKGMTIDSPRAEDKLPCPGAWVRHYTSASGRQGRVFSTTYGASEDILNDGYRRMLVNACFWSAGLEDRITADADIEFVGPYHPTTFRFEGYRKHVKPSELAGWDSPILPDNDKAAEAPQPKAAAAKAQVVLQKGDHVCLVGNALGERMQHHNYWETLLQQRFPKQELVVRNLCFPADEPFHRERSLNFGDPDAHLTHSGASVVLYFFGFNESFQGKKGLDDYKADLTRLVEETKTRNYSGKGAPRIVLISPIAFENTGDPNLPDGDADNKRLGMYADAMAEVAAKTGVGFVDLFTPTHKLFESTKERLTLNGAHLNDAGYRALAPIFVRQLCGGKNVTTRVNKKLRAEIADKNFHWWHRYRAVNGYSIYGKRGEAGSDGTYRNREVMERERTILDQMCANRDRRIWTLARGEEVADAVDDSNTLPFIMPKTNVGGENDPNRKRGKLGSLDYRPAAEQQKMFKLAPGYEISLVASEEMFPELANPVALNFDNQGRLWVSTMPSYPQWQPKSKLDDKLLILEDKNGDGLADVCKTFAGGLHQPTGFEIGMGGVYVAQQPDVLFLKDTDGDDREDVRIRQLVGFDSADSHHGLAAFEWGPGGALYFQEGTFKQSQVESPYGPQRLSDAGVWRYEPRSEEFLVHVSLTFANPWGHVFDRWGQNFLADASPGFNYWATPISGYIAHPDKHPGGSRDAHLDWGGPKSKAKYPTFIVKRTRPSSGCEIVSSRQFPPEAQGNFLVNNVIGDRAILQHTVAEEGSGFTGSEVTPLVSCDDGNFRPVDLQFGPDGALYIVDWHNALIGHLQHNLREPHRDHSHGRIWKITYRNRPLLTPPKIAGEPVATLLNLLKEPEDRTRYRVRRELAQRKTDDVIPLLNEWVSTINSSDEFEHHLLEALWMFQTHNVVNEPLLKRMLNADDHRARAAATRVLCEWRGRVPNTVELLRERINDTHPRVRLEAIRACSFFRPDEVQEAALDVLNHDMDTYLEYTLDETMRQLDNY